MKILFTGGSSFTGYWFVKELAEQGHEIVMTLRGTEGLYTGIRKARLEKLKDQVRFLENTSFGDENFLKVIKAEEGWDLLCHHAADVTNYKSLDFDIHAALDNNTKNISQVLEGLADKACAKIILTGSVFENGEGAGSEGLPAFSPYGLSKALTANVFEYHTHRLGLSLGKFVIANPFGPYEEPRFTSYLAKTWLKRDIAGVKTPDYVRDNIHVSLLSKEYCRFVEQMKDQTGFRKLGPSGYVGSQGVFAFLMAHELSARLDVPCEVSCSTQKDFDEPRIRINTDVPDFSKIDWSEKQAWDELADYYSDTFLKYAK